MKKIVILLVLSLVLGVFVSCRDTEADVPLATSVEKLTAEFKEARGIKSSLTEEDVLAIFDVAREAYGKYSAITITDGTEIVPVDISGITATSIARLTADETEVAFQKVKEYRSHIRKMGLQMIESIVGAHAVLDLSSLRGNTTVINVSKFIALDLEGSGTESAGEIVRMVQNGDNTYRDTLLMVIGGDVRICGKELGEARDIFPSKEEDAIYYKLYDACD